MSLCLKCLFVVIPRTMWQVSDQLHLHYAAEWDMHLVWFEFYFEISLCITSECGELWKALNSPLVCLLQARMDRTDIGTLLIPNIKMSDAGTYMCVGSNNIGSNSSPIKVTVHKGELSNMISQVRNTLPLLHFIFCQSSFKWIQGPYKWKLHDFLCLF